MTTFKDHSDNIWVVHRACKASSMAKGPEEWIEEANLEPNSTADTRMIPLRFFYEVRSEAVKMGAQLTEIRALVASQHDDVAKRILRIIDEGATPWKMATFPPDTPSVNVRLSDPAPELNIGPVDWTWLEAPDQPDVITIEGREFRKVVAQR